MRITIAAVNSSPAVASRIAQYNNNFRVSALLDAQPIDHAANDSPTHHSKKSTWQ
jgi:hypothetical protein